MSERERERQTDRERDRQTERKGTIKRALRDQSLENAKKLVIGSERAS